MQKIKTGIDGFDQLVFGGLPKGRTTLIAGEPGTGKTLFSLQYLLAGINDGETVVFVTIDEQTSHILEDARSLGWDLETHLKSGALKILDITKYFSTPKQSADEINFCQVVDDIIDYVTKEGATRLAIDPVAPLIFSQTNIPDITEYIRHLILRLESKANCTTLLTSYIPVGSIRYSQHGIEEFAASGIVLLKLVKLNNKYLRTIGVRKMRASKVDLTEYNFEIITNRGIVLRQPI